MRATGTLALVDFHKAARLAGVWIMLRQASTLSRFPVDATDGTIGHVKDAYFDDEGWAIRYSSSTPAAGWWVARSSFRRIP